MGKVGCVERLKNDRQWMVEWMVVQGGLASSRWGLRVYNATDEGAFESELFATVLSLGTTLVLST